MIIRKAVEKDIPGINNLLSQVLEVHHIARPDLFKSGTRKYTDSELVEILKDENRPIFVATDDDNKVLGYSFCVLQYHPNDNILTPIKTLYIDDLCVDENSRGMHVGTSVYNYVLDYARSIGCYNVTLNVWEGNDAAIAFYNAQGLKPQKYGMETIL